MPERELEQIKLLEDKKELTAKEFFDLARLYRVFEQNVFNPEIEVLEETPVLWVESNNTKYELCTPGAMGIIVGKAKSRKTVICQAITSCIIGPKRVLGFTSTLQDKNVLYFDTEQKKGTFWNSQRKVLYDAGINYRTPNYKAILLREYGYKERLEIIKDSIMLQELIGRKPDVIFIDGLLDLVKDANDNVETGQLVEALMHIAAKGITLIMVIHLSNVGTIYGHLGSIMARKVDFAIEVELKIEEGAKNKNTSPYSTVSCKLTRDTVPFDDFEIYQDKSKKVTRPDLMDLPVNKSQIIYTLSHPDKNQIDQHIPF